MKDHGMTRSACGNIADVLEIVMTSLKYIDDGMTKADILEAIENNMSRIEKCRLLAKIGQSVTSLTNTEARTIVTLALSGEFEDGVYNNRNVNVDVLRECLDDEQYALAMERIGVVVSEKTKRGKRSKIDINSI